MYVSPRPGGGGDPLGQVVLSHRAGIAGGFASLRPQGFQAADEEAPHRMTPKVGGNESQPQRPVGLPSIRKRLPAALERRGVPPVPLGVGIRQASQRDAGPILLDQQEVAVHFGRAGLDLEGPLVAGGCLVARSPCCLWTWPRLLCVSASSGRTSRACPYEAIASSSFPLLGEGDAQVVHRLGVVGPDFQGPAVAGDRLDGHSQIGQGVAEVVVSLRVAGFDFQGPAVTGNRLVELSSLLHAVGQVVV